jgi:hypothetical protein
MAPEIIAMAVKGHHYITLTDGLLQLEEYRNRLANLLTALKQRVQPAGCTEPVRNSDLEAHGFHLQRLAARRSLELHPDLQAPAAQVLGEFCSAIKELTTWNPSLEALPDGSAKEATGAQPAPSSYRRGRSILGAQV